MTALLTTLRTHATALDEQEQHAAADLLREAQGEIERLSRKLAAVAYIAGSESLTEKTARNLLLSVRAMLDDFMVDRPRAPIMRRKAG